MKEKYTKSKKANRFNNWLAYQKSFFSSPVFLRRVEGFFGADHAAFSAKHKGLDNAVEGYKSRIALASQGIHNQSR